MENPTSYREYTDTFIQRIPRFILKTRPGKRWRTVNKPLGDRIIQAHLNGIRMVGALGKWYPSHAILDIDKREVEQVQEIRSAAGLTESSSMLCSSESLDNFHLLLRPTYNNKPPTVKLLDEIFQPFCDEHGIEIFPRSRKCVRLPFGKIQRCLDEDMRWIDKWQDKFYWFQKLDEFDLAGVPGQQLLFEPLETRSGKLTSFQRGRELFQCGLQVPGSRHESQFEVLYYLWRKNVPLDEGIRVVYNWIQKNHNGFSKEISTGNTRTVKKEIQRQAARVWSYEKYPDSTHNTYHGCLTKTDIVEVLKSTGGSLPKARFLFHLIKYFYPRRHRNRVNIHSDLLIEWASRDTYQERIRELEKKKIAYRGRDYLVDVRSKEIKVKWDWRSLDDAILIDDRAPETLEDTIRASFTVEEIKALLRVSGIERNAARRYTEEIFERQRLKINAGRGETKQ